MKELVNDIHFTLEKKAARYTQVDRYIHHPETYSRIVKEELILID